MSNPDAPTPPITPEQRAACVEALGKATPELSCTRSITLKGSISLADSFAVAELFNNAPAWLAAYEARVAELEADNAELELAMTRYQTSPELATFWGQCGRDTERAAVVAWLRTEDSYQHYGRPAGWIAAAITAGEHLKGAADE